jgi:hypothetical protein
MFRTARLARKSPAANTETARLAQAARAISAYHACTLPAVHDEM